MPSSPIIPADIIEISSKVANGEKLLKVLKDKFISPLEFFKFLDKSPDDKILFEQARRISIEMLIDDASTLYDSVMSRDELDIAKAKIDLRKWMAEKLISNVYGTKVQHDVSGTISIRAALGEMDERMKEAIETTAKAVPSLTILPEEEKSDTIKPEDLY